MTVSYYVQLGYILMEGGWWAPGRAVQGSRKSTEPVCVLGSLSSRWLCCELP